MEAMFPSIFYYMPPGNILPHQYIVGLVLILAIFAVLASYMRIRSWKVPFTPASVLSAVLFSKGSGGKNQGFGARASTAGKSTFHDIFLLERAGAWCEERIHTLGRGLVLWGFVLLALATVVGFLIDPLGAPDSAVLPVMLLGDVFQGMIALGAAILLLRRLSRHNLRISTDRNTWALQLVLLVLGASGATADLLSIGGFLAGAQVAFLVNIASIVIFFLYAPFSELTFLVWKGSLLMQETLQSESGKGREIAPQPQLGK
ncbi:MAG: hypothetical protein JRN68_04545 [Nitrososphaerota archaeon]|jgi:nitrate reductase gamma subunit|nr:hypothetical protein [Nitrososphaerota archaeon]